MLQMRRRREPGAPARSHQRTRKEMSVGWSVNVRHQRHNAKMCLSRDRGGGLKRAMGAIVGSVNLQHNPLS